MATTINPTGNFIYYLERLQSLLIKIEQNIKADTDILHAQLSADMLPFSSQVATTTNFALRACCPLAGRKVISFMQNTSSFAALKQGTIATIEYLKAIPTIEFDRPADETLREQAGFTEVALVREQFLYQYALPNFYFHFAMAYAIARSHGIPLSKQDFDGHHKYPEGFSFVSQ